MELESYSLCNFGCGRKILTYPGEYCVYSEMTRNFVTKFYTLIRPINFACINLIECYAVMILFSSIEMARIEVECSA